MSEHKTLPDLTALWTLPDLNPLEDPLNEVRLQWDPIREITRQLSISIPFADIHLTTADITGQASFEEFISGRYGKDAPENLLDALRHYIGRTLFDRAVHIVEDRQIAFYQNTAGTDRNKVAKDLKDSCAGLAASLPAIIQDIYGIDPAQIVPSKEARESISRRSMQQLVWQFGV